MSDEHGWNRLMDSEWVNIVNAESVQRALDLGEPDIAVTVAVRLTEARLRELNELRMAQLLADRKELVAALSAVCSVIDRHLGSLPNTGYRSDSPMGRARSLLARIQKESSNA